MLELAVQPTEAVLSGWDDPRSVLTDIERDRAATLRDPADRDDFVAAHLLARSCVARLTGETAVTVVQRCPECGGDHGKPSVLEFPGLWLSWSHTRGHVGAVAAHTPVGIDVEAAVDRSRDVPSLVRRTAAPAEAERILRSPDPEAAYLHMWVAKEALVKVGALTVGRFRAADVHRGTFGGFDLAVRESEGLAVGLATRSPAG